MRTIGQTLVLTMMVMAHVAAPVQAQGVEGGFTLAYIPAAGPGIMDDGGCASPYRLKAGGRIMSGVLSSITRVVGTVLFPFADIGATCVTAPQPPRTDGTYVVDNQVDLLESGFLGTDVRFEISSRAEGPQASLALGIGNNWREGPNVPYFLVATGITWVAGRRVRVGAELEYQHLRVSADQVQLTYEDGRLIETVPLGRVHDWSYAWSVGVYLGLGF